ncbi:DJ-1/PfpI family protein [Rapidithrix thailandica]|uniref:DJ-1/PfpI family protein n=1 Tax=Rapidithrix thailandica TaxID=413964 RepID=A0AAW9SCY7_9BACT
MNKVFFCLSTILSLYTFSLSAQSKEAVVLLEGFDPVLLVDGKNKRGLDDKFVVRGGFKYLFSSEKNKKTFEENPGLYEVQNNGECTFMPGIQGNPGIWKVYQKKIYLFGTVLCRERFNLAPEAILHPEKCKKVKKRNVAIVLYEGVELLDFAGPGEVFAATQTVDGQFAFNVFTVAASTQPIVSQGFLSVQPEYSFANAPQPDIIVVPGGDIQNLMKDEKGMTWVKMISIKAEIAMSVCNGAFAFAKSKLLENKSITTHWTAIKDLRKQVPSAKVFEEVRYMDNGQVVTTAGVSAGIDGALHIVERLLGLSTAKFTARYMEYDWEPGL